jgi:hypothetical protein
MMSLRLVLMSLVESLKLFSLILVIVIFDVFEDYMNWSSFNCYCFIYNNILMLFQSISETMNKYIPPKNKTIQNILT